MLPVTIENAAVRIGPHFAVTFQRTLRIPEDSRTHPLPPGLGRLPLYSTNAYADRMPPGWNCPNSLIVPMYQREALWLGFHGAAWKPNAVKVAVGGINVLTGDRADMSLRRKPQDYLVCPNQPWLDGVHAENSSVRQFVATPLGPPISADKSQDGDLTHSELQITVFEAKAGKFPDRIPGAAGLLQQQPFQPEERPRVGFGVAGPVSRQFYPDPYGADTWDTGNPGRITVHIVNSLVFRKLTGTLPPPTPIDAGTYLRYGLPWFDRYLDRLADCEAAERMAASAPLNEIDRAFAQRVQQGYEPFTPEPGTDEKASHAGDVETRRDPRTA